MYINFSSPEYNSQRNSTNLSSFLTNISLIVLVEASWSGPELRVNNRAVLTLI